MNPLHAALALLAQAALWATTGNLWYGVAASAFYAGRELAQAEYRWIERYGAGRRANMPFWGQFDPRVWTFKSLSDMLLPLAATALVALFL